jgi:hypothetical protein
MGDAERRAGSGRRRAAGRSAVRTAAWLVSAGAAAAAAVRVVRGVSPAGEAALTTETDDTATITQGILALQRRYAAEQHRGLARGTHAKGLCVEGRFEVFDLLERVPDRQLARRLARGLFARPGIYPADVRFANADSHVYPDPRKDVRACSFSVAVPAGDAGMPAIRRDFSLNDASTFPINDTHAFAVTIRVVSAPTMIEGLRALSLDDRLNFLRTAVLGARQERRGTVPYQRNTYWSTVPFQHGPGEVAKYKLTPGRENPARPLTGGPNALQDELRRHLDQDTVMSSFDFGIQLLDVERMTYWGQRRPAAFWVENASVAWREQEAPFHTAGRLTLVARSVQSATECASRYIDVTTHCDPDCPPVGSINRARAGAERASRDARFAAGR